MTENNIVDNNSKVTYTLPISQANQLVKEYLFQIKNIEETNSEETIIEYRKKLNDLVHQITAQERPSGDADDIHNLSVELSREDEYELSCDILLYGLKFFPRNVDLLADYLQSGICCNQLDNCEKYYTSLRKIPETFWTWRGFAFSVDYLLYLVKNTELGSVDDYTRLYEEMLAIVQSYRANFPQSEDSYKAEADIYAFFNKAKELELLKNVIENENIAICPKCALRYAELKFESGEYEEAASGISKALLSYSQPRKKVHGGYLYYMAGLLKLSRIVSEESKKTTEVKSEDIIDIYTDFNIALPMFSGGQSEYKEGIKDKTKYLIGKYNVKVPPEMENLNYFI